MRQSEPRASASGQIPLKIAIDVATVAYSDNGDDESFVHDLIENPIIALPEPAPVK